MRLMKRLAVPIVILLLMLMAGAVWALFAYLDLPKMAGGPPAADTPPSVSEAATPAPAGEEPSAEAPATFDVVRIDPKGISVFAGRATPGENVTIMGDGKPVGSVQADENGEWTLATEHPFASADPKLALVKTPPAQAGAPAAQTKVAGSLEAHDSAQPDAQPHKSASAVTSHLMKNFEGIVAAARTAAKEEKSAAQEDKKEVAAEAPKALAANEAPSTATANEAPSTAPASEAKPVAIPDPATLPADTAKPGKVAAAAPLTPSAPGAPNEPAAPTSIPVPITFVFNEATFTDDGRKAVGLLLEYLQLKHFGKVTLTGHADERGTEQLNIELSAERLGSVEKFLRDGGFKGRLELIPKGESEPFTGVVRAEYPQEDLWQFDRRVELIIPH
jgi:outer membrane protein OmpA-like peptidoglycan-associated protein